MLYILLYVTSFLQNNSLQTFSYVVIFNGVPSYRYTELYFPIVRHLGYFQFFPIINNAAVRFLYLHFNGPSLITSL